MLAIATGAAVAADLQRSAPAYKARTAADSPGYSWEGTYIGGHLGRARVDPPVYVDPSVLAGMIPANGVVALLTATAPFTLNVEPRGWFGGLQAGHDWQRGRWVYGVEADISFANLRDEADGAYNVNTTIANDGAFFAGTVKVTQKVDYFGTLRGRFGVAFDNWLVYATGGFAWAHVETTLSSNHVITLGVPNFPFGYPAALNGNVSAEEMQWGYAAGGGLEWAFRPNWSLRGEYLYLDLSRSGSPLSIPGTTMPDTGITMHLARAAVNYRFRP